MILAQLVLGDGNLLSSIVAGFENLVHQPLVAGSGAQHAAHEIPAAVGMGKGMEGIVGINTKLPGGNKHGAGGAQADIAAALSHDTGADGSGSIVACAGSHLHGSGNAQFFCHLGHDGADAVIAFKELRHLGFLHTADGEHFLRPALVLNIQQQHAGGIGIVAGMDTGENVVDIVLGQHDLCNAPKVLRLVLLHPQQLGGGEACKGNVGSQIRQLLLADDTV